VIALLNKLRSLVRRSRRAAEIREELEFHLDEEAAEGRAAGLTDDQARAAARRDLGNPVVVAEETRAAWGWRWLEHLTQDVVYAGRMIRRRPGFTASAVLSLTLGIGANVAIFSLLDALLMQQLPVRRPGELVQLVEPSKQGPIPFDRFIYSTYDSLRAGATGLASVAVMTDDAEGDVEQKGDKHRAVTQLVSENYFEFFGVDAAAGRVFHPDSDGAATEPVAVISDSYWRRQFGASTAALGATIRRGKLTFTVVGVAPRRFKGVELEAAVDVWFLFNQVIAPNDDDRTRGRWVRIVGRLGDGATPEQVSSAASSILRRPVIFRPGGRAYSSLRNQLYRPLMLVMFVVVLVLLITCANLGNLTLAGNLARERELAVRRALGASRWRIIRQLLTESLLLALAGGTLAVLVASWLSGALLGFLPPQFAPALADLRFSLDLRVLALAGTIAIVTTLTIGLLPAVYSTRSAMSSELRIKSGAQRTRSWTTRSLIVGEIAICSLLLMLAGVFLRSVQNLRGQDAGYTEQQLLVADVAFPFEYGDERRDVLIDELQARVGALPGVGAVAYSNVGQLSGGAFEWRIGFPDRPYTRADAPQVIEHRVSPGFLAAMGTKLYEGRDLAATDSESAPLVAVVNDLFAAKFFPGRSAIGQRFFHEGGSRSFQQMEIVGVVQSAKWLSLRGEPLPMYYRPYAQQGGTPVVRFAIRAASPPEALAAAVTAAAISIDRGVRLTNVVPFSEIVNRGLVTERLVAYVSTAFGLLGLLIAAIGLYGVLAYNVTRRKREIGVRIAVGATRGSVERMFLRESFVLFALGLAIGVPLGIAVTRSVAAMLYGVGPQDPSAIASVAAVLALATAAAAYFPARRAASIDPIVALREE
jgi:putative ABC transport system permease protein